MTRLFIEFFKTEKASGIVLIFCTATSLALANSPWAGSYGALWQLPLLHQPLTYWINDALMTLFFLLVGLEIEREIYVGELSAPRKALLPIVAALGGMVVPALLHFCLNAGTATERGFGIPMATDIAFALGVLSLLGKRVPVPLKVFLTAFAIIDDLGAIIVIALFYTASLSLVNAAIAAGIIIVLLAANRMGVTSVLFYLVAGTVLWYFVHASGIHGTITGVILAFLVPFRKGDETSPSFRLQHGLHYIVAFLILPLFALANTAVTIGSGWTALLLHPNSLGIMTGLVAGKVIGISLFSFLAVRLGMCALPDGVGWKQLASVSVLGGIGFTMSIFITLLAFQDSSLVEQSKIAIVMASCLAGIAGYLSLRRTLPSL
jgi:Na+:H+ antiporter, NhaA family